LLQQQQIRQGDGRGAFENHRNSQGDTGVVSSFDDKRFDSVIVEIKGFLRLAYRRGGLDRHPKNNIIAVGDATVNTSGVIRFRLAIGGDNIVIVFTALHAGTAKARAEFYSTGCRHGEDHMGDHRLRRIEKGFRPVPQAGHCSDIL